eukprot:TRINITY_DN63682_c0_g1_i1.p1 TRINITY_DN63682_c0_g1~~TRINITY_DN63682_c0_g1_i1.p1  ORF type:complete len:521 (-),score=85.17 TRINITY_DN63682_c0_g1_i1:72-1634(-)
MSQDEAPTSNMQYSHVAAAQLGRPTVMTCPSARAKKASRRRSATEGLTRKAQMTVEGRLYGMLQRLMPETRRMLIAERLSESERLALERWILTWRRRTQLGRSLCFLPLKQLLEESARPITWNRWQQLLASSGQHLRRSQNAALAADWRAWNERLHGAKSHAVSGVAQAAAGGAGIHRRRANAGYSLYAATGKAGPFRLYTRSTSSLETATLFRKVLLSIRHRLSNVAEDTLPEDFRDALTEEPAEFGLDAKVMGLRFAACIGAGYWIGRQLQTPRYDVTGRGLEEGLKAWRCLVTARRVVFAGAGNRYSMLRQHSPKEFDEAWQHLRSLYLDIWARAGRSRRKVARRLDTLELQHAPWRRRSEARWRCLEVRRKRNRSKAADAQEVTSISKVLLDQVLQHSRKRSAGELAPPDAEAEASSPALTWERVSKVIRRWSISQETRITLSALRRQPQESAPGREPNPSTDKDNGPAGCAASGASAPISKKGECRRAASEGLLHRRIDRLLAQWSHEHRRWQTK